MATISIPFAMQDTVGATLNPALQTWPEILGTIYVAHYRYVLQVCRRFLRQREDAEDAASEVFLKLQRVWHTKDVALPFRPWVCRVAGRHCIDKLRRRKVQNRSCVAGTDVSGIPDHSTPSQLSQVLSNEERRQVREQLIRLPERYKVPLILHYYKRMSYSEIARTLNRRVPAVKTLIFRAKGQLRRNIAMMRACQ